MTTLSNKEESIKGKEYNPPTPQMENPAAPLEVSCEVAGKVGDLFLELKKEEPEWAEAKKILEGKLSAGSFRTWISPLIFERSDSGAILRGHNNFFCNWVKNNFSTQIEAALATVGLREWKLDVFTEEQQKADSERKEREEKLQKEVARVVAKEAAQPDEDVDSLPLDEQFKRLYNEYPKQRARKNAWKKYRELFQAKMLPKLSELLNAVRRSKKTDESWQRDNGRYAPQLHRWLSEERWLD